MARDGSGTHSLPQAAFVSGTTIESAKVNSNFSDISSSLTASLAKDGQTVPTANLPMGNFKHTGVADGSSRTDYASLGQVAKGTLFYAADTGAADAYAVAPSPGIAANVVGFSVDWKVTNANLTTTPTLAVNSLTAGTIKWPDGSALIPGDLPAGALVTTKIVSLSGSTPTWHLMTVAVPSTGIVSPPQGRLTLTSATPVLTGAVTAATTIYYALYNGNRVPIYNGTKFVSTVITELSNITSNSATGSAGPAAVTTNSNYDLFVWSNAGVPTLTRGPAWTSDTGRGTGAGTTQISRVLGIYTNTVAITNGPGAGLGTYVGTVRSDGSSQINWQPGAVAANGTAGILGVWNAYNRVEVRGLIGDTTDSWSYSTATIRPANNSSTMRVSFVVGLQEDFLGAEYQSQVGNTNAQQGGYAGVGYDSTTAFSGRFSLGANPDSVGNMVAPPMGDYDVQPLGFHYLQALEKATGTGTSTWYGDSGATFQTGLRYSGRF